MIRTQEIGICREKGMPLLDIRTEEQFGEGFIEGAVNIPLFRPIEGWEPYQLARRVGYALFGVFKGTEPNPDFLAEVEQVAADKEVGVVVCCNLGGTLEPEPGKASTGIQSRSLIAAYELVQAGYMNVRVLNEGVNGWKREGRETYILESSS